MNTLKTILAPVDLSPGSCAALLQAARLAGLHGASLHVLHVVDLASVAASRHLSFDRLAATVAKDASAGIAHWLARAGAPADCHTTIVEGVPLHEILDHVKTLKPDLVVAGINGSGDTTSGSGSIACRLACKVPAKVLLVRPTHQNAFQKIVACIDFSDTAREVAAQAHRVAVQDGARVDFLHVWQEPWLNLPYAHAAFGSAVPLAGSAFSDDDLAETSAALSRFVGDDAQGIESRVCLVNATNHGTGIAAHARQTNADLIVIGRKGRTNLRYVLMGSTTEKLLTILPCSVLVVNPESGEL